MRGLEIGRIQSADRALDIGRAALDDSLVSALEHETFGGPISKHKWIDNYLADTAFNPAAAHQPVLCTARLCPAGHRVDLESGIAKLFASSRRTEIAPAAPLVIGGEVMNGIQRNISAQQLVGRNDVAR